MTIISGKGTLYGAMRVGTEVANFDFIIPSEGIYDQSGQHNLTKSNKGGIMS